MIDLILLFIIGIAVSIASAAAGGGAGLVTVPILIFFGLPANSAIGTNKFGALGSAISTSYKFTRAKKIVFKYVIPFSIINIIGAVIGAQVVINISEQLLSKIVAIIIISVLPVLFIRQIGFKRKEKAKKHIILGYLLFSLVAIYEGFFGAGAGIFTTYILIFLFGLTYLEANATKRIPWLVNLIVTIIIFALNDLVVWRYGFALLTGRLIGGYIGTRIAVTRGNKFVKYAFSVIVVIMAVRLLFF